MDIGESSTFEHESLIESFLISSHLTNEEQKDGKAPKKSRKIRFSLATQTRQARLLNEMEAVELANYMDECIKRATSSSRESMSSSDAFHSNELVRDLEISLSYLYSKIAIASTLPDFNLLTGFEINNFSFTEQEFLAYNMLIIKHAGIKPHSLFTYFRVFTKPVF